MQKEHIVGTISVVVGSLAIIFRTWLARDFVEFQNRFWGFHFVEREIKANRILLPIFGVCAIIFGLLSLFQIIHFKR